MLFLFRSVSRRLSSWTTADLFTQMQQLNKSKRFREAIDLFDRQAKDRLPTDGATSQALHACVELKDFQRGSDIHRQLSSQSLKNSFIQTNLIRLYMKSGDLLQAENLFQMSSKKTSGMYDAMLNGLAMNHRPKEALDLFEQMTTTPNAFTLSIFFKICTDLADDRSLTLAKKVFQTLSNIDRTNPLVASAASKIFLNKGKHAYGEMMLDYLRSNRPQQAIDLFLTIDQPDSATHFHFFHACAQLATKEALAQGKKIFEQLPEEYRGDKNNNVGYAVFDMFIRCEDLESAEALFRQLKRDVICYSSLMNLYNQRDQPEKTLSLFEEMKEEKVPSDTVLDAVVIQAAGKHADLSKCQSIVSQLSPASLADRTVQNVLIDMWGRAGSIEQAKDLFATLVQPDAVSFAAMINAYGFNKMGSDAVQLFRQVPPEMHDEFLYTCLFNACSNSGLIDQASSIFEQMPTELKTHNLYLLMIDSLGCSSGFDQAQQLLDQFETAHPPSSPLYLSMLFNAREQGKMHLAEQITHRIRLHFEHDEKCLKNEPNQPTRHPTEEESRLWGHAELLAIAFQLIQRPVPSVIQLSNNLRVCHSCHDKIKFIARLYQISIILRDPNRIHRFSPDGQCSCRDYF